MDLLLKSFSLRNTRSLKESFTNAACNTVQVDRINIRIPSRDIHRTPGVNVDVFIPIRGITSSFAKWSRNIKPLDTSVDGSATQERNSDLSCIEKVVVKRISDEIVTNLDPSIWVYLAKSIIRKSQKFINLGLLTFDATGKPNIAFTPSNIAKSLNVTGRENFKDN